jgi:hypothetical protein
MTFKEKKLEELYNTRVVRSGDGIGATYYVGNDTLRDWLAAALDDQKSRVIEIVANWPSGIIDDALMSALAEENPDLKEASHSNS